MHLDKDKFNGNYDEQSEPDLDDIPSSEKIVQDQDIRLRVEERRRLDEEAWNSNPLTIKPLNKLQHIGKKQAALIKYDIFRI